MQVVAIVAARNEERFITDCFDHLLRQGVQGYLIDNGSTDRTVTLAERFLGRGLVGIETIRHEGTYPWRAILERKEQVGAALDADWIMHVDADERPLPPAWASTLAAAFAQVAVQGYNAVNFIEFTFVPTREAPDHDHPDFQRTMCWYYPFIPLEPFLTRAWKRQRSPVELAWSGGHLVRFPGLRVCPESFPMRHYQFLSVPHAVEKYVKRPYDPVELEMGWHGWRARLTRETIELPMREELREYSSDRALDATNPRTTHYLDDLVCASLGRGSTAKPA
jgi:glycosyltransferase involved in cell wall biosynthesis